MSESDSIKPLVLPEEVALLLQEYFGRPVHDLQPVQGGNVAQTYSFTVSKDIYEDGQGAAAPREYIVRFNPPMPVNFEKEAYAYEHFASPEIPIPSVVRVGRLGELDYAITEKAPGRNLLQVPRDEYMALIPQLIDVLDAIHGSPVSDSRGYGIFDGSGVARWLSWRAYLESVMDEPEADFFEGWRALFETSFLERDLFDRLYRRMLQLAEHCPEERYLVHGDFGYSNVLAQDFRITAVLDWMSATYGDILYDVAWLEFWSAVDGWRERFAEHYRSNGRATPHYAERVLCYQCFIALNSLKFYAKIGAKPSYDFAVERIDSLLNAR
jgi:hygromycin-B 4-O-kinase